MSVRKTIRSPAAQGRFAPPSVSGNEPLERVRALPHAASFAGRDVGDPDRPGERMQVEQRLRRAAGTGDAHERDVRAVGRPRRRRVARGGRREIADGRRVAREDADERVIAARSETNASFDPSGDQAASLLSPRAKKSCFASDEPSVGTIQI